MLPLYKTDHITFLRSKFVEFILILANCEPKHLFQVELPSTTSLISPGDTVLVLTDKDEIKILKDENKMLKKALEDKIKMLEKALEEKRQKINLKNRNN